MAIADLPSRVVLTLMMADGVLILLGAWLARRGRYRLHGACQSLAYVLIAVLVAGWMIPTFRDLYAPDLRRGVVNRADVAVAIHATLGATVVLLGAWVVLVAGTPLVPARLRFANYKGWMRALLALWWLAILAGTLGSWLARL